MIFATYEEAMAAYNDPSIAVGDQILAYQWAKEQNRRAFRQCLEVAKMEAKCIALAREEELT